VTDVFSTTAMAEYLRCFSNPDTIHASCEDYREGATIDLEHDEADLSVKLDAHLLILWGEKALWNGITTFWKPGGNVPQTYRLGLYRADITWLKNRQRKQPQPSKVFSRYRPFSATDGLSNDNITTMFRIW
jgi:hypothetical protein